MEQLKIWTKVRKILVEEKIINTNGIANTENNQKLADALRKLLTNERVDKLYIKDITKYHN
jgi:hypothetical protein